MRNIVRLFPFRSLSIASTSRQCFALKIRTASSKSDHSEENPSEKMIEERFRTKERQLTSGEIFSRANLAPQIYHTSMDDNFQRTTVSLLGHEMLEAKRNYIRNYSEMGFMLADETILAGPVALFPKTVLSWRVKSVDDITPDSVLLFTLLEPKLDIVVVGVGDKKNIRPVNERLQPLFREHNILLEVLDTCDACATFNFLNHEGRYVAAALLPALEVQTRKEDLHPPSEFGKIHHGWFGFSEIPSTDPLDHAKKWLQGYQETTNDRSAIDEPVEEKKSKT